MSNDIDNDDLDLIRSDGNQVIRRIGVAGQLLEAAKEGQDSATQDMLDAACSLLDGSRDDVVEMQQLAIDVKEFGGNDD